MASALGPYGGSGAVSTTHYKLVESLERARSPVEHDAILDARLAKIKHEWSRAVPTPASSPVAQTYKDLILILYCHSQRQRPRPRRGREPQLEHQDWVLVASVRLAAAGPSRAHRRIGYEACIQLFPTSPHTLKLLLVNTIRTDLGADDDVERCKLALSAVASDNLVTVELVDAVRERLFDLVESSSSRDELALRALVALKKLGSNLVSSVRLRETVRRLLSRSTAVFSSNVAFHLELFELATVVDSATTTTSASRRHTLERLEWSIPLCDEFVDQLHLRERDDGINNSRDKRARDKKVLPVFGLARYLSLLERLLVNYHHDYDDDGKQDDARRVQHFDSNDSDDEVLRVVRDELKPRLERLLEGVLRLKVPSQRIDTKDALILSLVRTISLVNDVVVVVASYHGGGGGGGGEGGDSSTGRGAGSSPSSDDGETSSSSSTTKAVPASSKAVAFAPPATLSILIPYLHDALISSTTTTTRNNVNTRSFVIETLKSLPPESWTTTTTVTVGGAFTDDARMDDSGKKGKVKATPTTALEGEGAQRDESRATTRVWGEQSWTIILEGLGDRDDRLRRS
ncbi:hypothetical protein JCM3766R1_003544, partial [Sporobolomyces carnicolor]